MKLHIIFSDVSPLAKTVSKLEFYIKNNLKLCKKFFMFKVSFTVVFIQKLVTLNFSRLNSTKVYVILTSDTWKQNNTRNTISFSVSKISFIF